MKFYVRLIVAIATLIIYLTGLRFLAPGDQPYFFLGIGVVAFITWLLGTVQGLSAALLLVPLTNYIYQQFSVSTNYESFSTSPAYLGLQLFLILGVGHLRRERFALHKKEEELAETNIRLQTILSQVQELGGLHNMCSECKKIQSDDGEWQAIDAYLKQQTKIEFSHCICPDCARHYHEKLPGLDL